MIPAHWSRGLACFLLVVGLGAAQPMTIDVPAQMASIQAAMDTVALGGTVRVAAGTYTESLDFRGRDIRVVGAGAATTILSGHGVTFSGGETPAALLEGIRIAIQLRGGPGRVAVDITAATPTLRNCQFEANGNWTSGLIVRNGGVFAERCQFGPFLSWEDTTGVRMVGGSASRFVECDFIDCMQAKGTPVFLHCFDTDVEFRGCRFLRSNGEIQLRNGRFHLESCSMQYVELGLRALSTDPLNRALLRVVNSQLIQDCSWFQPALHAEGLTDAIVEHCTVVGQCGPSVISVLNIPALPPSSLLFSNSVLSTRSPTPLSSSTLSAMVARNSLCNQAIPLPGFSSGVLDLLGPLDLRLGPGSAAIDRAISPVLPLPDTDVGGLPRRSYVRRDLGAHEFLAPDTINVVATEVLPVPPAGPSQLLSIDTMFPNAYQATLFEVVTPASTMTGPWAGLDLTNAQAAAQLLTFSAPFFAPLDANGDAQHTIVLPPGLPTPVTVRGVTHVLDPMSYALLSRGHFSWTWQ